MTISLGCDHGGFDLKEHIKAYLEGKGHTVKDCGTYSKESCDYPLFGAAAAKAVADGECERGVVICTTGIGISIAANKVKDVRCALCSDPLAAEMTRRHNNANMLAMGAGMLGRNMAERIVDVFLSTEFEGGRHQRRVDEISDLEA
ncbi:MAG: ribose 5-phosphate isomerase B [Oscillospiraceae bacterium]|nr:ribose 5-phosphate isomerase B [Oscillospiraceae bacterium]